MKCLYQDCQRSAVSKGMCDKHYRRHLKGRTEGIRKVHEGNEVQRFMQKFEKRENGCWIWIAGTVKNAKGIKYGKHWDDSGKTVSAHRFSYKHFYGGIPKGMFVCHKCDTPLCVNPNHLWCGTHKDNMKDMTNKNRQHKAYGERFHTSKLTNAQAIEIRKSNLNCKDISEKYNVSKQTIRRIRARETYKDAKTA